ncbi:MAG TPA: DUF1737 domain-containing protein [Patescibacteria group bacterium]|nr:DUF1737 domain-containing protein [Patescibacteria group bacterium]
MKVVEYKVVISSKAEQLTGEVNRLIQEGWQPHGSMTYQRYQVSERYIQPVVKVQGA